MPFVLSASEWLWVLFVIPLVLGVWIYGNRCRARDLALLAGRDAGHERYQVYRARHMLSLFTTLGAVGLIVFALSRPGWNPKETVLSQSGRDVVFLLDVSQSMLAEDRHPNRLENAKLAIADCMNAFDTERVGLVVFAGSSSIQCPLTRDYEFFRLALEKVGSDSVHHGGTLIGEAISKTCDKLFSDSMRGFQDLVLITDGGDQEKDSASVMSTLNRLEAHLIVVGVGSDEIPSRIPIADTRSGEAQFLQYQGLDVTTMQDGESLKLLSSAASHGVYLNAGVRPLSLHQFYERYTAHAETIEFKGEVVERYEEGYQAFLFAALVLLVFLGPLSDGLLRWRAGAVGLALVLVLLGGPARAGDAEDATMRLAGSAEACNNRGSDAYREGEVADALEWYRLALVRAVVPRTASRVLFNAATVRCSQVGESAAPEDSGLDLVRLEQAMHEYRQALDLDPSFLEAGENLELARREYRAMTGKKDADDASANKQSQDGDGEPEPSSASDEGDESEGDESESDEDSTAFNDGDSPSKSSSTGRMDMNDKVLPPPNLSPQDLLNAESEINRIREQRRSGRRSNVEKDW